MADFHESRLTVRIENTRPVELVDLTESLLSLAEEYKRFVYRHSDLYVSTDVKLYIKEIRTGSIITDLVSSVVPLVAPLYDNRESIVEFGKWLKQTYDHYKGKVAGGKPELDKTSYKNLSAFLQPVAKDGGSQVNISNTVNGEQVVNININALEANAMQNLLRRDLASLQEPASHLHEKVVLYWHQAKNDPQSSAGDRGIIESISPNPVKVVFAPDSMKTNLLYKEENPFKSAYIVDVWVETVEGKPALYKVVGYHDRIEL